MLKKIGMICICLMICAVSLSAWGKSSPASNSLLRSFINILSKDSVAYALARTAVASSFPYANRVVSLVNQERAKAGLMPLTNDTKLTVMALDKAKDMYNKHYFDHTSPTFGSPFDMMNSYGIHYTYAGENIAMGQKTPQEVMTSWMNSAGHRQNILNPNFTKIGVSYYNGEWVQEFIAN
jgi:uncharacterized YkwD family protein